MRLLQWPVATLACVAMVVAPSLPAAATEQKPAAAVDLSYIPATAVGAVVFHPQQLSADENAAWIPVEIITAAGLRDVGFDPMQVEEAIALVAPPDSSNPPKRPELRTSGHAPPPDRRETRWGFGAILHFARAYSRGAVLAKLQPMAPEAKEINGKNCVVVPGAVPLCVYMPDERTIVVGTERLLGQMIAASSVAKNADSQVVRLLRATDCSGTATAVFSLDAMRDLVNKAMAPEPGLPAPTAESLRIPKLISSGVIQVDLGTKARLSMTLRTADPKSAEELRILLVRSVAVARQGISALVGGMEPPNNDPLEQAMRKYMERTTDRMFEIIKPVRDGSDVKVFAETAANAYTTGVIVGLLLPMVQQARGNVASRFMGTQMARVASANVVTDSKLTQIALALLNYHSAFQHFPARAIFGSDGKPLLSWRVQILPFLEQGQLYREFHLEEAWDSPHNRPLIAKMPAIFAGSEQAASGKTHFVVPVGKGTMFDGDTGIKITDVTDGTDKTILAVEADNAVIWTKPDDLDVDLNNPLRGLGHLYPDAFMQPHEFLAIFVDGHIGVFPTKIDPRALKAMFTRAGGEVVDPSALQ